MRGSNAQVPVTQTQAVNQPAVRDARLLLLAYWTEVVNYCRRPDVP